MAFNSDPYAQAAAEVANKSAGSQIAHSGIFHSVRSAFSSKGSAASKGIGLAMGVGKLFLALIPVPVVGAIVGATVDAISGKVRSAKHEHDLKNATTNADKAKFAIKELTVENLDRYRWKVAHSFEELNQGLTAFNASGQGCDDMYAFCLLYEQVERRKKKLVDELDKFKSVLDTVNLWIADLEATQTAKLTKARNDLSAKMDGEITALRNLVPSNVRDAPKIRLLMASHADCKLWCYCKKEARYDPNTHFETVKTWAGKASQFLKPIAVSSVAVRGSDYTSNSDNSKFTT